MYALPLYPFDPQLLIGTVTEVGPTSAKTNLPHAASPEAQWHHGQRQGRGEIGDFVVIEVGDSAVFGRIVGIRLPEKERLSVEPELGRTRDAHPVGTVQLLSTVALHNGQVTGGISRYPRLGSRIYSAHSSFVQWIAEATSRTGSEATPISLDLGSLPSAEATPVQLTPERLFGRHCAVLGATGGGKSWTVARLIEQASRFSSKLIVLDATGEFHTLSGSIRHVHIGGGPPVPASSEELCFPHNQLTENDLFALFKPSIQSQAPKLRQAMKSLRLVKLEPSLASSGLCLKVQRLKKPILDAQQKHAKKLEHPHADFDVSKLPEQILEECVWPSGGTQGAPDHQKWGAYQENEKGFCITLITRLEDMLSSPELAPVLRPALMTPVSDVINEFIFGNDHRILRISLKYLSFAHSTREVVANAIGRLLLNLARDHKLKDSPLLVFLDEAHQFLDKSLGDEANRYPLDSFDLIAKEGRKYSLNICIATQRPRDIPDAVLSQMGTLIVHRLINDRDREVVERASGEIDRSAAAFLPTLAPGQAVIIGVDFPIPLTIQVSKPGAEPDSKGPDYQTNWSQASAPKVQAVGSVRPAESVKITDDDIPF